MALLQYRAVLVVLQIFVFFHHIHSLFYLVKCLFCVLKHGFCVALIMPFSGTPWSGIWWLSVTFQGITCEGKEILSLTSLELHMILYNFFLICLNFFSFLLSVVFKGWLLLGPFCWMPKLWSCCWCAIVCWWINPEALQIQICLVVIVRFQLGGNLISSGKRKHSSLWSSLLLRSA